jgi:putative hydrolase of the HAD superfamily
MIRAALFDMYETLCSHYRCPLYFGAQIAEDWGVEPQAFFRLWRDAALERARTLGQLTLEELLERIALDCGITDPVRRQALIRMSCGKRLAVKRQCLRSLHPEILPMLWGLKARGLRLGLVSNCYREEAQAIREWAEGSCLDALLLSCEQGAAKPDPELFLRAAAALGVSPGECLYIGDGGSRELYAARELGMEALQAVWYIQAVEQHPSPVLAGFDRLERPMEVWERV